MSSTKQPTALNLEITVMKHIYFWYLLEMIQVLFYMIGKMIQCSKISKIFAKNMKPIKFY